MLVSVDLGYGYVKAVSEVSRVIFPSLACPAPELDRDFGLGHTRLGHVVEFRAAGAPEWDCYLVGELALRGGRTAQLSLSRERFTQHASVVLTAAAAYLAGAEGRVELALGLPLAYYPYRREEARRAFEGLTLQLRADGGPERSLAFGPVQVFPQGVGALFSAPVLLERGLVGLVDVGFFTTDYLIVELTPEGAAPLPGHMSSLELGVSTAVRIFADSFRDLTGKPLTLTEALGLWGKAEVTFAGRRLELSPLAAEARKAAGHAIANALLAAWSGKAEFVDAVLLAGGGALEFGEVLSERFPGAEVLPDPLFANALGFARMARRGQPGAPAGV